MAHNPYLGRPDKAFWRKAVAGRSYFDLEEVATPLPLALGDRFATAGSCFAQHIGRNLAARGAVCLDAEPAPDFLPEKDRQRFGYGIYSARYGNIYTARQLLQLTREALGEWAPLDPVWTRDGRFYDALRPSVDPVGHGDADAIAALRRQHLAAVRSLLADLDVFIFTLGLTEAWADRRDGCVFPVAPGVICGDYDPERHAFVNLDVFAVYEDMAAFYALLKGINPGARLLLTVSPVPLIATASPDHVLVATVRSKSILRAASASLADRLPDCHYFPSYELIASHPARGQFFDPDLRSVNARGVNFVMGHFFAALGGAADPDNDPAIDAFSGVICDEERIETEL